MNKYCHLSDCSVCSSRDFDFLRGGRTTGERGRRGGRGRGCFECLLGVGGFAKRKGTG